MQPTLATLMLCLQGTAAFSVPDATAVDLHSHSVRSMQASTDACVVTSIAHNARSDGSYFHFFKSCANHAFAASGTTEVVQERDGEVIWTGEVVTWPSTNGGSSGDAHGRRSSGTAAGQWEDGDVFYPVSSSPPPPSPPPPPPNADNHNALESVLLDALNALNDVAITPAIQAVVPSPLDVKVRETGRVETDVFGSKVNAEYSVDLQQIDGLDGLRLVSFNNLSISNGATAFSVSVSADLATMPVVIQGGANASVELFNTPLHAGGDLVTHVSARATPQLELTGTLNKEKSCIMLKVSQATVGLQGISVQGTEVDIELAGLPGLDGVSIGPFADLVLGSAPQITSAISNAIDTPIADALQKVINSELPCIQLPFGLEEEVFGLINALHGVVDNEGLENALRTQLNSIKDSVINPAIAGALPSTVAVSGAQSTGKESAGCIIPFFGGRCICTADANYQVGLNQLSNLNFRVEQFKEIKATELNIGRSNASFAIGAEAVISARDVRVGGFAKAWVQACGIKPSASGSARVDASAFATVKMEMTGALDFQSKCLDLDLQSSRITISETTLREKVLRINLGPIPGANLGPLLVGLDKLSPMIGKKLGDAANKPISDAVSKALGSCIKL